MAISPAVVIWFMVTMIQKFKNKEEQDICKLLISWINDGSHNFADDLFIEVQDDTIEKYLSILNKNEIEKYETKEKRGKVSFSSAEDIFDG